MYSAYPAKLLTSYPSDTDVALQELPGWTARKSSGRGIYVVTHNLHVSNPDNISITGIPLEANITVNFANIDADSFSVTAQKNGDETVANFMFVLVVKN